MKATFEVGPEEVAPGVFEDAEYVTVRVDEQNTTIKKATEADRRLYGTAYREFREGQAKLAAEWTKATESKPPSPVIDDRSSGAPPADDAPPEE